MVFGLLCDIECIIQCFIYKPTAFKHPLPNCLRLLAGIGIVSLVMSAFLIIFSYLAFTPLVSPQQFLTWFFYCLDIKAVTWSPFIALEYYDLLFENIYFDV